VEKGDILTLASGILIVLVIAVIANPQYLAVLKGLGEKPAPTPVPTITPLPVRTVFPPTTANPAIVKMTPGPLTGDAPPYQIFYTEKPFLYPVFKLPENMETFGGPDIVSRKQAMIPFAFIKDQRGGLTQTFSVPYPVWVINTTVTANRTPQYGRFRMALLYAANGTLIEGDEILNRGTSYRVVQTSNTELYMIISTAYIDGYYISLEAPRDYYDLYRPK
jgi:hypothetical protein